MNLHFLSACLFACPSGVLLVSFLPFPVPTCFSFTSKKSDRTLEIQEKQFLHDRKVSRRQETSDFGFSQPESDCLRRRCLPIRWVPCENSYFPFSFCFVFVRECVTNIIFQSDDSQGTLISHPLEVRRDLLLWFCWSNNFPLIRVLHRQTLRLSRHNFTRPWSLSRGITSDQQQWNQY